MHGFATVLSAFDAVAAAALGEEGQRIAPWFFVGVFALSASAKLRSPDMAAIALVQFGLLRTVRVGAGAAVGIAEAALAGLLAFGPPAIAFGCASVLLWFFVVLIARQLHLGHTFDCFCFGEGGGGLSRATLTRTGVLALAATGYALCVPSEMPRVDAPALLSALAGLSTFMSVLLVGAFATALGFGQEVANSHGGLHERS